MADHLRRSPSRRAKGGFHQGKVAVVIQSAVTLVGRLEDVQFLHRIDAFGGAKSGLENASRDVVA